MFKFLFTEQLQMTNIIMCNAEYHFKIHFAMNG